MILWMQELWLCLSFAFAMFRKMRSANRKYLWDGKWRVTGQSYLAYALQQHVYKGDPSDVGIFAAILWHHRYPTNQLEE